MRFAAKVWWSHLVAWFDQRDDGIADQRRRSTMSDRDINRYPFVVGQQRDYRDGIVCRPKSAYESTYRSQCNHRCAQGIFGFTLSDQKHRPIFLGQQHSRKALDKSQTYLRRDGVPKFISALRLDAASALAKSGVGHFCKNTCLLR